LVSAHLTPSNRPYFHWQSPLRCGRTDNSPRDNADMPPVCARASEGCAPGVRRTCRRLVSLGIDCAVRTDGLFPRGGGVRAHASAGAKTNPKLTSDADHQAGADHCVRFELITESCNWVQHVNSREVDTNRSKFGLVPETVFKLSLKNWSGTLSCPSRPLQRGFAGVSVDRPINLCRAAATGLRSFQETKSRL
jgi:hypothetical protein